MAEDLSEVSPLSVTVNANIWQDYRGDIIPYWVIIISSV